METKQFKGSLIGASVGALTGAVAQYLVAVSFFYYIHHEGGPFWGGNPRNDPQNLEQGLALQSAFFGLLFGGVAGATCNPIRGFFFGAVLSGMCCGAYAVPMIIVAPMNQSLEAGDKAIVEIIVGWVAMVLAGAVSGAIGATVGARIRKAP